MNRGTQYTSITISHPIIGLIQHKFCLASKAILNIQNVLLKKSLTLEPLRPDLATEIHSNDAFLRRTVTA